MINQWHHPKDRTRHLPARRRQPATGRLFGRGGLGLGLLLLAGCTPARENGSAALPSRFFCRAEIIGTRGTAAGQFNKPRSLVTDRDDNLYVVDMTGRVQKFSPDGQYLMAWQMPQTVLGKPKGMAVDREGNIVVIEPHYQRVNHYTTNGLLVAQWGQPGTNAGEFSMPRAVAVSSNGNLYVSEYTQVERVQVFTPGTHRPLRSFGRAGTGDGEFNRAEGLGIGPDGRVYVADSCNHRIQLFTAEGQWLKTYGRAGAGSGELSYPYDVCVDAAGYQYVCEFGNSRIQIFDAANRPVEILGGPGNAPGKFNNPWSLALDSRGNLYVADSQNHRVQKLVRMKN